MLERLLIVIAAPFVALMLWDWWDSFVRGVPITTLFWVVPALLFLIYLAVGFVAGGARAR